MLTSSLRAFAAILVLAAMPHAASAHFLWIVAGPHSPDGKVHVYFSEDASPDDPNLLDRVAGAAVWHFADGKPQTLKTTKGEKSLVAETGDAKPGLLGLSHSLGVLSRGNSPPFLLKYYAKCLTSAQPADWNVVAGSAALPLEVVPRFEKGKIVLRALFQGKPSADDELVIAFEGSEDLKGKTGADGEYAFELPAGKTASIRVRHVEPVKGELDGKKYEEIRHYSTLTLAVAKDPKVAFASPDPLVTSFGAAIAGGYVYMYGGHKGGAHDYSRDEQVDRLSRLDVQHPDRWEAVAPAPHRAGTALVAHRGKLYRIGGFEARNKTGDKQNLVSTNDFARFDPAAGKWEDLAALPEGRSSHDAVVIGDKLYVVGGWKLNGAEPSTWHDTALVADLSAERISWQQFPAPFRRRALSIGEWKGKVVAVGGMQEKGGISLESSIYDPAMQKWSDGPQLNGEKMDGFGSSTFLCGDQLYTSTYSGKLQRLSSDGAKWEVAGELAHPRFHHRMLATSDRRLLVLGGATMASGKIREVELLTPGELSAKQAAR